MSAPSANSGWLYAIVGLGVGLFVGYLAAPDAPQPNPQERSIDANLWQQTSGEYHALCLQTYRWAGERLRDRLAARRPEAIKSGRTKPFAVVMDLDETVF